MNNFRLLFLTILCVLFSCTKQEQKPTTHFTLLNSSKTNIDFKNVVRETEKFNFLNYSYIYNGGGVSVIDVNNDGLEDLFFTSNQSENKLYLNKGDLEFKDISKKAQITDPNGWTTGTTVVDINNDGWLDIYVCKSASINNHSKRRNKLYINQKNNTFKESAKKYGLDHFGFSTQAYFFDFDNDGDLDMYLVSHRKDFRNTPYKEPFNSDQLFRNEGNNTFTNITKQANILNKGWGLSASIGDFNNDGWLDVYVANDFYDPDYLYINQKNGTFKNEVLTYFNHISTNSMGSDFADLNNDLNPDLVVLDMMAEDHIRSKENMATMSIANFRNLVKKGYHHQYMSNMMQLNNGNKTFSEIGQLAGIAKTDWSWSPLIADFDNDGYKDIFITNGIENDLTNQDFRNQMKSNLKTRKNADLKTAKKLITSDKLSNYIFKNNSDLTFKNTTKKWGLNAKVNSNGAAYADLDNDGDLDLIINNQGEKASIYRNNSTANFISFSLKGDAKNPFAIGSNITVYSDSLQQTKSIFTSRGFQSSVTNNIHFGLGKNTEVDSIIVSWNSKTRQKITNLKVNKNIDLDFKNGILKNRIQLTKERLFQKINPIDLNINYQQKENDFDDYLVQLLLPQKQSSKGNSLTVADINKDGLDDFFVGNAKGKRASLYIQKKNGTFTETNKKLFENNKEFEDTDAKFIDIDNDKDLDILVTSGGYEVDSTSTFLQDRIYINNGRGNFKKTILSNIKNNSKAVTYSDFDKDGDLDVFIGNNAVQGKYPLTNKPQFLENRNGKFINIIDEIFDDVSNLNIINDAIFTDFDNDGDDDLIVVGEWMPVTIYENKKGKYYHFKNDKINDINGWFQSIKVADLNNDGNLDFVIGNWGNNNKFHPSKEKPLHIYADYFDDNKSFDIALSKVSKTGSLLPVRGKECSTKQTPFLNEKIKSYKEFASLTMPEIYGEKALENATHLVAHSFSSIILYNNGNGNFEIEKLPNEAQFSPTLDIEVLDLNNDGFLDIFGVGNVNDAEVETVKYDASKGYILLGNKSGKFTFLNDNSYFNNKEARAIKKIQINGLLHFIILNKNDELTILKLKKY